MANKEDLEVGQRVYVLGCEGEVWDMVESNASVVKVLMKSGPAEGQTFLVVLKQVELY
jgi:hypothetical protein